MTNVDECLTTEQLERIERNRQRAQLLRESSTKNYKEKNKILLQPAVRKQQIDSHAGFFIEDDPNSVDNRPVVYENHEIIRTSHPDQPDTTGMACNECKMNFLSSFLHKNFDEPICDECREKFSVRDDDEDSLEGGNVDENSLRYGLVTRTVAKEKYLLTDFDLDKREPILKCLEKKNPHNQRWGKMRLYLRCQVQRLSEQIHQGKVEEKLTQRDEKRAENKRRKYEKQVEQLRLDVRTSLQSKPLRTAHEHKYDEQNIRFDPQTETYSKICIECGFRYEYEEM